ncbi:MAG: MerR family transcriptional regulator [Acidimicrobiales bacterium]
MKPPARYRVRELAAAVGVSVELLRSYQSRGLLPPPAHEGRIAWYDASHLERLRAIQELKERGWSLRAISEHLAQPGDGPSKPPADILFDRDELSRRTGVPTAVLRSLESSGVLRPRTLENGHHVFTVADVHAVRALLSLLSSGLPIEEFMAAADVQLETARTVTDETFKLFVRYIRQPLIDRGVPSRYEAERLVAAMGRLLRDLATLYAYNTQRMVLEAAQRFIAAEGTRAEQAAMAKALREQIELAVAPDAD